MPPKYSSCFLVLLRRLVTKRYLTGIDILCALQSSNDGLSNEPLAFAESLSCSDTSTILVMTAKIRKPLLDPERRRRGIYILPNLFTTAALFAGFYAIVQGMNGKFEMAAIAVFIAMVLDGLDGRVARFTRTQSAFGAQLDSLSDMVSFGAAPALIMYAWALQPLGKWGWMAAFVHCAGAALRLARFNVQLEVADKRFFTGIPSPAAAAIVCGMVWVFSEAKVDLNANQEWRWVAFALTIFTGITMVSNLRYYSGKEFNLRRSVPFWVIPAIIVGYMLITIEPATILWGLFLVYAASGYVLWALGIGKTSSMKEVKTEAGSATPLDTTEK
jgi:CDP-diacylglycerol---serine O-phosphatidyltransferase